MNSILTREFYSRHPLIVAKAILGKTLVRRLHGRIVYGIITDTEAYGPPMEDPAVRQEGSRGLRSWEPGLGWTTYLMRGRPTLNVTTNTPSCVLVRAVEPNSGWEPKCSPVGPLNLAKALRIDGSLDRVDVTQIGPLFICQGRDIPDCQIVATKRIGLKVDIGEPRRFYIRRSRFVSRSRVDPLD
jgi:DNA-3-methyladenine glycosylase